MLKICQVKKRWKRLIEKLQNVQNLRYKYEKTMIPKTSY